MKKAVVLKAVNILLALSFIWVAVTALLHEQIPRVFHNVHPIGGFLFTALAITHIILNWNWIKNSYFKKKTG